MKVCGEEEEKRRKKERTRTTTFERFQCVFCFFSLVWKCSICPNLDFGKSNKINWKLPHLTSKITSRSNFEVIIGLVWKFQMFCFMTFVQIRPPSALNIRPKAKWPHLTSKMTSRSNFEVTTRLVFESWKCSVLWHLSKFDLLRH